MKINLPAPSFRQQTFLIAEQVIFYRKKRGLSQKELSKICGLTQSEISRYERKPDTKWKFITLRKICEGLKCHLTIRLEEM